MGAEQLTVKHDDLATLPLSVVRQIDSLADEFEAAWQRGEAPRSTTYVERLGDASDEARAALTAQLAQIQTELASDAVGSQAQLRPPPRPIRMNQEPALVGEYRLLEQLGSGGMGIVYKAMHARLDRFVAIKFPRIATALDPYAAARFLHEARMIGRLDHPNIVRALDAGDSEYGPYLVTEFVAGKTLEDLVRRTGPLPIEQAVQWVRQAAVALAYAHSRNIVHRDVKPSNLLLDGAGTLRIVDFGLAKILADDQPGHGTSQPSHHTQQGTFLGTVGYAAPEQLQPGQAVDHRADIYALGCVLYYLLTGEVFHAGSLAERLAAAKTKPRSLRSGRIDISVALERAWRRMVAIRREARFGSMDEVVAALGNPTLTAVVERRPAGHRVAIATLILAAIPIGALAWNAGRRGGLEVVQTKDFGAPPAAIAPFDVGHAKRTQQHWAKHLRLPLRRVNSAGVPLVLIPPGEFDMGLCEGKISTPAPADNDWRYRHPDAVRDEQLPRHRVVLTAPIYFGETEITNAQFRCFVEATNYVTDVERGRGWGRQGDRWVKRAGYSWRKLGERASEDDLPVINVTWNDANAFCEWLTAEDREFKYRLPTEAEWEFACRAGTQTHYFFGDDPNDLTDFAWILKNSHGRYQPVGTRRPNPFGLFDMYGNRQEWCLDSFDAEYYGLAPSENPCNRTDSDLRVLRGGAQTDMSSFCTSARRWGQSAGDPGAASIRIVAEIR